MAALHSALQSLSPVEYVSVPVDQLKDYLVQHFSAARILIDSVPINPSDPSTPSVGRSRANTTLSTASGVSEISASSARSAPPIAAHAALQKEWGKPIKLSAKENALAMGVYKLGAKDGRGAWFARRSVHEGIGFSKWRKALEREFPASMEVQGAPGEGNIRGIGGERRVERKVVDGVGTMEVYHLSAQFPGPTAPRDFVTLLLTSPFALNTPDSTGEPGSLASLEADPTSHGVGLTPRHFIVISKPCMHPDCPPREGFVRGQYESVEFIREIVTPPTDNQDATSDLKVPAFGRHRANTATLPRDSAFLSAEKAQTFPVNINQPQIDGLGADRDTHDLGTTDNGTASSIESRKRGKTISFAESDRREPNDAAQSVGRGSYDRARDPELNPVEWIMITRSDPGGSVPRWMVERGTPASIVADAAKFLDWACKLQQPIINEDEGIEVTSAATDQTNQETSKDLQALDMNGHLWGVEGLDEAEEDRLHLRTKQAAQIQEDGTTFSTPAALEPGGSVSARSNVESKPSIKVADELSQSRTTPESASTDSDISSVASFATASSGQYGSEHSKPETTSVTNDADFSQTTTSTVPTDASSLPPPIQAAIEKELSKLRDRKRRLQEKLTATRSKILPTTSSSPSELPPKESAALTKAEERHKKEVEKHEQKYRNSVKKIESKQEREERKKEEKRKKQEEKDERARWSKEREELKKEMVTAKMENHELLSRVGELQGQNTLLVAKLGKVDPEALQEVLVGTTAPNKASGPADVGPKQANVASEREREG